MRYFAATAMGGRLFVQGVEETHGWDFSHLVYWDSAAVDKSYHLLAGDRKVESAEELVEVLRASERGLPAIKVWVHEDLEAGARRVWKEQRRGSGTDPCWGENRGPTRDRGSLWPSGSRPMGDP